MLSDIPRHESHHPHLRRTTFPGVVWFPHIHWQVQLPPVGSGNWGVSIIRLYNIASSCEEGGVRNVWNPRLLVQYKNIPNVL